MTVTEPSQAERAKLEQTRGLATVTRGYMVEGLEVRAPSEESTIAEFRGHASVTDTPYEMYGGPEKGGWNEIVDRGAFKRTLGRNPDVAFLINHEGMTLARTTAGNLHLTEDGTGLAVRAELDTRVSIVNDLVLLMQAGNINEMSFAFRVSGQQWLNADGEEVPWWDLSGIERHIQAVDINKGDVSAVNYGANPYTDASLRKLIDNLDPVVANELRRLCTIGAVAEKRAGATLSAATTAVLQSVLDLAADADANLDDVLEQLSDLMGVPNPDEIEGPAGDMQMSLHPDLVAAQHRAMTRYAQLRSELL